MFEIYQRLVEELSAGRPAVLAAIIRQDGSSPRSAGTKCLICQDGALVGSIGGGILEASVARQAMAMMGGDHALLMTFQLNGRELAGLDMICGGNLDVLIQGFRPDRGLSGGVLKALVSMFRKGGQCLLVTGPLPESGKESRVGLLLFQKDGGMVGSAEHRQTLEAWLIDQVDDLLALKGARIVSVGAERHRFLVEPQYSSPTVIVFGAGHISVKLAPLLSLVGFKVVVVDDRSEFAQAARFPQAEALVVCDFVKSFDRLAFTPETFVVIVTRGHLHDKVVLGQALRRPSRYIGMIGSRHKRDMIFRALLQEGVSEERIKQVHSPIGLDIGAETPEEIAVSIVAEMIRVRAEGLPRIKNWTV